jgi:hypothetical protein
VSGAHYCLECGHAPHWRAACLGCIDESGPCRFDLRDDRTINGDIDPDIARDRRNTGRDERTGFPIRR